MTVPAPKTPLRTNIYVDGFNLYYRAVRSRPEYKWLDIRALARLLLAPENQIQKIWYFTANASGWKDPDLPQRQLTYIAALKTLPEVEVVRGNFQHKTVWAPMAIKPEDSHFRPCPEWVWIHKTEEKGSDVNLATHLIADAFRGSFDVAVVLSNDTDLVEPVRVVTTELKKPVGLICPCENPAKSLKSVASFLRHITPARLAQCQFPDTIPGTKLQRPASWVAKTP